MTVATGLRIVRPESDRGDRGRARIGAPGRRNRGGSAARGRAARGGYARRHLGAPAARDLEHPHRRRGDARRARGERGDPCRAARGLPARSIASAPEHGHGRREPAPVDALLVLAPPVSPAASTVATAATRARASIASTRSSRTTSAPRRTRRTSRRRCSRSTRPSARTAASLPLADLYRLPEAGDVRLVTLEEGEVLLELELPPCDASVYLKAMDRKRFGFPLVGVAAVRRGETTRVALAGVAPTPWLLDGPLDAATPLPGNALQGRDCAGAGVTRARYHRSSMRRPGTFALAGVLLLVLAAAGCGGGKKAATTSTTTSTSTPARRRPSPRRTAARPWPRRRSGRETSRSRRRRFPPGKTYEITMVTNCGSFTFRIDQAQSPNAAASVVSLVQRGFYNGIIFHRIVPGFVIQGGDPTGTGAAGPGYTTVDTPPKNAAYTHGRGRDGQDGGPGSRHGGKPVLHRHRSERRPDRPTTRSSGRSRTASPSSIASAPSVTRAIRPEPRRRPS